MVEKQNLTPIWSDGKSDKYCNEINGIFKSPKEILITILTISTVVGVGMYLYKNPDILNEFLGEEDISISSSILEPIMPIDKTIEGSLSVGDSVKDNSLQSRLVVVEPTSSDTKLISNRSLETTLTEPDVKETQFLIEDFDMLPDIVEQPIISQKVETKPEPVEVQIIEPVSEPVKLRLPFKYKNNNYFAIMSQELNKKIPNLTSFLSKEHFSCMSVNSNRSYVASSYGGYDYYCTDFCGEIVVVGYKKPSKSFVNKKCNISIQHDNELIGQVYIEK